MVTRIRLALKLNKNFNAFHILHVRWRQDRPPQHEPSLKYQVLVLSAVEKFVGLKKRIIDNNYTNACMY